jgi:hypothetical protein
LLGQLSVSFSRVGILYPSPMLIALLNSGPSEQAR